MTGKGLWGSYEHYTRDITEHGRILGFGAAGICWLFKRDDYTFPSLIYFALFFVVVYFISDFLQPLSSALILRIFIHRQEGKMWAEKKTIDGEIHKPRWIDRPTFFFFLSKCIFLILGFSCIGLYLARQLFMLWFK